MAAIDDVWVNRPDDVRQNVEALANSIDRTAQIQPATDLPGVAELNQALQQLAGSFDPTWGGFGGAPKFPSTMSLDLVLRGLPTITAGRRQDHRHDLARRDGQRRDVRPHRRRLRPLLGRRASGSCPTSRRCCTTRRC